MNCARFPSSRWPLKILCLTFSKLLVLRFLRKSGVIGSRCPTLYLICRSSTYRESRELMDVYDEIMIRSFGSPNTLEW